MTPLILSHSINIGREFVLYFHTYCIIPAVSGDLGAEKFHKAQRQSGNDFKFVFCPQMKTGLSVSASLDVSIVPTSK